MKTFIIKGNKAKTTPDFLLKDLPGSGGRMDILCRCLTSALLVSHGIRRDVEVILCLDGEPCPPRCIRVVGKEVRHLSPDERSTAVLIKKALKAYEEGTEVESTPGIYISGKSFEDVVMEKKGTLVVLDEKAVSSAEIPYSDPCFVLGDHLGFTEAEEMLLRDAKVHISVSPTILHASHCIVLVHAMMDSISV